MDNKQFLTEEQIYSIITIVMRDYVDNQVNTARNALIESDEFKAKFEEIKASKEWVNSFANAEKNYKNNLSIFPLLKQIKDIDLDLLYHYDSYEDKVPVSWLVDATEESIEKSYEDTVNYINNDIKRATERALKINSDYEIRDEIRNDLRARLRLTSPSDFDSIVNNIVKYIDINKHLHYS